MAKRSDSNFDDEKMSGTASRSGYDSSSQMYQGRMKEVEGKLTHDKSLEDEGVTQQVLADEEEKEILKPWRREHQQS